MHVGTQEVAHLDLLSFRVWGRGWGWGWGWGGINNESCISLNASTNHLILLQLFLHTKYREQLPSLPFPPDDVFPPFLIPQFLFLLYLHVSILVRFSSLFIFLFLCFRLLRPLVLPGFPFLSFLCCLPPPYSRYLCTSCSFCSTRGRSGRSGVKKGLLCPGNRTWVNQHVARSSYWLLHIYTILTYKEFVILLQVHVTAHH